MKHMMKILISVVLMLAVSCGALAEAAAVQPLYKAGAYQAEVAGQVGPIVVETVFDEDEILEVNVLSHSETRIVSTPAIEKMPQKIVEAQSLAVDTVSSCTVTSAAILYGVRLCAEQAGADLALLTAKLPEAEKVDEELQADVIVVGGGLAGLTAAASAADSGKQVILFEKLAAVGGSSALSGGMFDVVGTQLQKDMGVTPSVDELVELWMQADEQMSMKPYNAEIDYRANRKMLLENSLAAYEFLNAHGDPTSTDIITGSNWGGYALQFYSANRKDKQDTYDAGGAEHTDMLEKWLKDLDNVEIRYESPVVELIVKDGAVCGVIADAKSGKVTAYASDVILATGGYNRNGELLERFTGEPAAFAPYACAGVGTTGDGIVMAEAIGADVYDEGFSVTMGFPLTAGYIKAAINGVKGHLIIDANGGRVVSFNAGKPEFITKFTEAYKATGAVYELYDSASASVPVLEENLSNYRVFKAETLAELAALIGVDPAALEKTVADYNAVCDAGSDPEFGQTTLVKIENGPFYATSHMLSNYATFGGLKTNDKYEVLAEDGTVIPGLYAAGELVTGKIVNQYYMTGSMLLNCIVSGMIAGAEAAL